MLTEHQHPNPYVYHKNDDHDDHWADVDRCATAKFDWFRQGLWSKVHAQWLPIHCRWVCLLYSQHEMSSDETDSSNAYWLAQNSNADIDKAFADIAAAGLTTVRTWGFNDVTA